MGSSLDLFLEISYACVKGTEMSKRVPASKHEYEAKGVSSYLERNTMDLLRRHTMIT